MPRILTPAEVDALTGVLRTHRDRAMVAAMVLGGLCMFFVRIDEWGWDEAPAGIKQAPHILAKAASERIWWVLSPAKTKP